MDAPRSTLWFRRKIEVNTDPQRRCYNGCHFSSEMVWTEWSEMCTYRLKETADSALNTFKTINPNSEYKVLPEGNKP